MVGIYHMLHVLLPLKLYADGDNFFAVGEDLESSKQKHGGLKMLREYMTNISSVDRTVLCEQGGQSASSES